MPNLAQTPSVYAKLGLAPEATAAEIDATFLRLALQHHPLKHPGDGLMKQRYMQLVHAYYILGSAEERARYDAAQAAGTPYRPNGHPPARDQAFMPLYRRQAAQLLPDHPDAAALCAALLARHFPMALAKELADTITAPPKKRIEPALAPAPAPTSEPVQAVVPAFTPAPSFGAKAQPKVANKAAKEDYQPYAPPKSMVTPQLGDRVWRSGKDVVVAAGSDFPHRCVRCNAPVNKQPKSRTYYWHSPWYYLLLLLNLLILLIVVLIVRKKVKVAPALCDTHLKRRHLLVLGLWGSAAVEAGLMVASAMYDNVNLLLLGLSGVLVTLIVAAIKGPLLRAMRIDPDLARFRGAGQAFLDGLPQR